MAEPTTFLSLPAELRTHIYELYFDTCTIHIQSGQVKKKSKPGSYLRSRGALKLRRDLARLPKRTPALLYTTAQIAAEARAHLHRSTYAFPTTLSYLDITLTWPPARTARLRNVRLTDYATTFRGLHGEAFEATTAFPTPLAPPLTLDTLTVVHAHGADAFGHSGAGALASLSRFLGARFFAVGAWLCAAPLALPGGPGALVQLVAAAVRAEAGVGERAEAGVGERAEVGVGERANAGAGERANAGIDVRVRLDAPATAALHAAVARGNAPEGEAYWFAREGLGVVDAGAWAGASECFGVLGGEEGRRLMEVHEVGAQPRIVVEVRRGIVGCAEGEEGDGELVPVRHKMMAYSWKRLRNKNVMEVYDGTDEMIG